MLEGDSGRGSLRYPWQGAYSGLKGLAEQGVYPPLGPGGNTYLTAGKGGLFCDRRSPFSEP